MNDPFEVLEYRGMEVKLYSHDNPESPRFWDNLGTMVCKHRDYLLGDEQMSDPIDWLVEMLDLNEEYVHQYVDKNFDGNYYSNRTLEWLEGKFFDRFYAKKLYLYDHSGITMSTGQFSGRWDSGQVGYIYVSPEQVRSRFNIKRITKKYRKLVDEILEGEVQTYDMYIRGDVFGYVVEDAEGVRIDSCWGFYDMDSAREYFEPAIDHYIKSQREAKWNQIKLWIKNRVPLYKRILP